jgi:preprotein translocase subunit SecB
MSEQGNGVDGNGAANGEGTGPRVQVVAQYVRDLSFENPGAPGSIQGRPQIDFGVDLQARRMENEQFEVELKLRVSAKAEERPIFLLELVYAGMFALQNIPEESLEKTLLIEGPTLLFPFARRIVADAIRDGGMPPLMIEPIDFASLYQAKQAELQQARGSAQPAVS